MYAPFITVYFASFFTFHQTRYTQNALRKTIYIHDAPPRHTPHNSTQLKKKSSLTHNVARQKYTLFVKHLLLLSVSLRNFPLLAGTNAARHVCNIMRVQLIHLRLRLRRPHAATPTPAPAKPPTHTPPCASQHSHPIRPLGFYWLPKLPGTVALPLIAISGVRGG